MFKTTLSRSGNGIGRRLLLVALSALLVITTLIIIPGNAYGDEDASETTTSVGNETDTTVSDTTVPDTTIPAETTTTVAAEPAPVTETTTTSMAVEEDAAVTETTTTTSAVVEEDVDTVETSVDTSTTTTAAPEPTTELRNLEGIWVEVPITEPSADLLSIDHPQVDPLPNPTLPAGCGLNIALVFDKSNSVDGSEPQQFRDAAKQFVDALQGTPSQIGLTSFAGITASGGIGVGLVEAQMAPIGTIAEANAVKASIDGINFTMPISQGGTNWEDAFIKVGQLATAPQVIVFMTDGQPTTHDLSPDTGFVADPVDLYAGIEGANGWKTRGVRIIGVGISMDATGESNLQDISGPIEDSDWFSTNFDDLGDLLSEAALEACSSTVTITKWEDPENDGTHAISNGIIPWEFSADATESAGTLTWNLPTNSNPSVGTIGNDGTLIFDWTLSDTSATADVVITETVFPDWEFEPDLTTCTIKTPTEPTPVDFTGLTQNPGGLTLNAVPSDGVLACDVYNKRVAALIDIEKFTSADGSTWDNADTPTGPVIELDPLGTPVPVYWKYEISIPADGTEPLTNVQVADQQVLPTVGASQVVSGPDSGDAGIIGTLEPGETWIYLLDGVAQQGQYKNDSAVEADPVGGGDPVVDTDVSHYLGQLANIQLVKNVGASAGGPWFAADTPTGPDFPDGADVYWEYIVTNNGDTPLTDVLVTDVPTPVSGIDCGGQTTLAVNETMTCTASDIVTPGQFSNTATVGGLSPQGFPVTDTDLAHYFGSDAQIAIDKVTNGADGLDIPIGTAITWTYTVTNPGNVPISNVIVSDDKIGVISGPDSGDDGDGILQVGETWIYTMAGSSVADQYDNTGTADGLYNEAPVSDSDDSSYFGSDAQIAIDKVTNGADGLDIPVGTAVTWTYTVTNPGNVPIANVVVTDDLEGVIAGPDSGDTNTNGLLDIDEAWIYTLDLVGGAVAGQYDNVGTADGDHLEAPVSDSDDSSYFGSDPSIDLVKTGVLDDTNLDGFDSAGDTINYTFAVENTGNVTLTDVTLVDTIGGVTISGGPIASLAVNVIDPTTFTGTYVLTQHDIDVGHFYNVATVSGIPPQTGDEPPDPVTDDDDWDTFLDREPDIGLFKNGALNLGPDSTVNPGDVIVYTFTVENTGNTTLYIPELTDLSVLGLDLTCPWDGVSAYELLPGFANRVNCTAEYEVTQADIDAGEVNNCALIEAGAPNETMVEAEACTTVTEPQEPSIEIIKTSLTPEIPEGDTATFEITVTNTGNVTLSDVVVEDVLSPDCDRTFGGILIPGETVTYECTIDDVMEGFTNVATTRGTPPQTGEEPPPPVTDEDDAPVVLMPSGPIGDLVWNDVNENGIPDPGEKGIAGALVKLTLPDGSIMTAITDANGIYMFTDLPAGEYTVELDLDTIVIAAGEDVQLVTAGFFGSSDVSSILAATDDTEIKLTTPGSYTFHLDAGEGYLDADFGLVDVLPVTGLDTGNIAVIALLLLLAGGAAVFVSGRKREDEGEMAA